MKKFLTRKITRQRLEKFLEKYARADKLVLDLGCGSAKHVRYFPNRIGFDIAPGPGVDVVGDAHALPFGGNHFDMIVCTEVLEHLHTPEQAIAEMRRVLKPGGLLLLSTRFIFPIHDAPHDYFRYTKYGLKHLFRQWEILELVEETTSQETFAVLLQRVAFQTEIRMNWFFKVLILLAAKLVAALPSPILREYGSINRQMPETNILSSGYYLVCRKN